MRQVMGSTNVLGRCGIAAIAATAISLLAMSGAQAQPQVTAAQRNATALCAKITEKLDAERRYLKEDEIQALLKSQAQICGQRNPATDYEEYAAGDGVLHANNAKLCDRLQRRMRGEGAPVSAAEANRLVASRDYFCAMAGQ